MMSIDDILGSILEFNEDEYFTLLNNQLITRQSELLDMNFTGIAFSGPKKIICSDHNILPVIIAFRYSGERGWRVDLKKNCFIAATNLENGNVYVARALTSEKDEFNSIYEDERIENDESLPKGLCIAAAQLAIIDVRKKIPLTWNTGKWTFTLIYFDWVSNTIMIDIIGDDSGTSNILYPKINLVPNKEGITKLPSFVPLSQSPILHDTGLVFMLDVFKKGNNHVLNLFSSFSLHTRPHHICQTPTVFEFSNGQKESINAIIPITILLLVKNNRLPFKLNLNVPVYGKPVTPDENIQGHFAFDLLSIAGLNTLPSGEYVCYLVLDGKLYGPHKFAFTG